MHFPDNSLASTLPGDADLVLYDPPLTFLGLFRVSQDCVLDGVQFPEGALGLLFLNGERFSFTVNLPETNELSEEALFGALNPGKNLQYVTCDSGFIHRNLVKYSGYPTGCTPISKVADRATTCLGSFRLGRPIHEHAVGAPCVAYQQEPEKYLVVIPQIYEMDFPTFNDYLEDNDDTWEVLAKAEPSEEEPKKPASTSKEFTGHTSESRALFWTEILNQELTEAICSASAGKMVDLDAVTNAYLKAVSFVESGHE